MWRCDVSRDQDRDSRAAGELSPRGVLFWVSGNTSPLLSPSPEDPWPCPWPQCLAESVTSTWRFPVVLVVQVAERLAKQWISWGRNAVCLFVSLVTCLFVNTIIQEGVEMQPRTNSLSYRAHLLLEIRPFPSIFKGRCHRALRYDFTHVGCDLVTLALLYALGGSLRWPCDSRYCASILL